MIPLLLSYATLWCCVWMVRVCREVRGRWWPR